jgi:nucleoside-diphosphate-sugar epimerase
VEKKMKRVLVTGATGAIGIPLVKNLIKNNIDVTILVRDRSDLSIYLARLFGRSIHFLIGDTTQPYCGVNQATFRVLARTYDAFMHVAGKTQYHEHLRADTYKANLLGTENALALATELEVPRFLFVSTCYVAGRSAYLGENETGSIESANNPYESSKAEAENAVRKYVNDPVIARLSTVIGEFESGHIVNAGGYAAFVKGLWAGRRGFSSFPNNPFWLPVNPESTLNLVTNEWAVDMIRKTAESKLDGVVHISHPNPVSMGLLCDVSLKKLGLPITYRRVVAEQTSLWGNPQWRKFQEMITEGIGGYFGPYVTRDTTFAHERIKLVPGYSPPPEITEEVIERQVDYMLNHLFVKKTLAAVA